MDASPVGGNASDHAFRRDATGTYRTNVTVSDGEAQASYEWTVTVSPGQQPSETSWTLWTLLLVVAVVGVVALVVLWRRRRKAEPEVEDSPVDAR